MEIEIPITPMLDMAFQLLTFFILTYRPAPSEGQFSMNLLPAQAATEITKEQPKDNATPSLDASLRTLKTVLRAGDGGLLGEMTLADKPIQGMDELKKELESVRQRPGPRLRPGGHQGRPPAQVFRGDEGDRRLLLAQAEAPDQDQLLRAEPDRGRGAAALSRRPSSLFRGSELPRLLFLVAIVLAGWPMIVLFARPQGRRQAAAPAGPRRRAHAGRPRRRGRVPGPASTRRRSRPARAPPTRPCSERARETPAAELAAAGPPRRLLHPPLGAPEALPGGARSTSKGPPRRS